MVFDPYKVLLLGYVCNTQVTQVEWCPEQTKCVEGLALNHPSASLAHRPRSFGVIFISIQGDAPRIPIEKMEASEAGGAHPA
jgi:hypothetical protein